MNILAVDLGERWIGTAYCNTEVKVAFPLKTFDKKSSEFKYKFNQLLKEKHIEKIIIGYPHRSDGKKIKLPQYFKDFINEFIKKNNLEYEFVTEFLTSAITKSDKIKLLKKSKRKEREREHSISAKLILDTFLETLF